MTSASLSRRLRTLCAIAVCAVAPLASAALSKTTAHKTHSSAKLAESKTVRRSTARGKSSAAASRSVVVISHGRRRVVLRRARYVEHFSASSFHNADFDNTTMDQVGGEDPPVRAALVEALSNYNGTALAIDPQNGRILAMVNQKQALGPGAEPCSTIKLTVALAALQEGLITKDTPVNLGRGYKVNLTYALARSVNPYFEELGREMGFETVKHYANQFGLGELAGYNVAGEQLGIYPDHPLPESKGGVGKMCSFGESVEMTPMQLGAIVAAIANGGSLFYLQHPTTPEEVANFQPRLKRTLNIQQYIPEMLPGMEGAVEASYGTARSLRSNFKEFPIFGKTGTCSNEGTRYGWFAGYGDGPNGRIVTVFFLTGGRPTFGPKAAELTGIFYRALADKSYFEQHAIPQVVDTASGTAAPAPIPPAPATITVTAPPATAAPASTTPGATPPANCMACVVVPANPARPVTIPSTQPTSRN